MVQKEEGIWFLKDLIRQMWHKYMSKMEKNGAHKQLYNTVMWAVTRSAEESQNEEGQCESQLVRKGFWGD